MPPSDLPIAPYDHDDDLLAGALADGRPRLRVYRPEGIAVVLGRGSRPEVELDLAACRADEVPLRRRRGGGCAVVLDPGSVVVALALPAGRPGAIRERFRRLSDWILEGLAGLGIDGIRRAGVSDLVLGDRKVGGACMSFSQGRLFYGITLLAEPPVGLMERYLRHPPREPEYRRKRRHAEFVGSLAEAFPARGEAASLRAGLAGTLGPPDLPQA